MILMLYWGESTSEAYSGKIKMAKRRLESSIRIPSDEWNPHIVRYVRDRIPDASSIVKNPGNDSDADVRLVAEHLDSWQKQWTLAQEVLNAQKQKGVYSLAYRLDAQLSPPLSIDPIDGSKFGGVPDFRREIEFLRRHDETFQRPEIRSVNQIISKLWPRCGCCGEYMRFFAGVDLSDWMLAIHNMTSNSPTHVGDGSAIPEPQIHYYKHSGLGFGKDLHADSWPLHRPFFNIFYCSTPHFDSPAFDSAIVVETRLGKQFEKKYRETPSDIEEYRGAISQFVNQHHIESKVPLNTLEGLKLKFDIDIPGKEFIPDWMRDIIEEHPEVFGSDSYYQFFGHPYSQQTERRYACQNAFLGLHRMAPIVNWTDQDRDFSYQVYGCLRCRGQENNRVYCKTDGSCT